MTSLGGWLERGILGFTELIVSHPRTVVVLFFLLTAFFAAGVPLIETETDLGETFAGGLEEKKIEDKVEEDFGDPFTDDTETVLIHDGGKVLSRNGLLYEIRLLERVEEHGLRLESANGPSVLVAEALDPQAETLTEKRRAIQTATDTEVRRAVREVSSAPGFSTLVSEDFNRNEASASASVAVISHDVPPESENDDMEDTIDEINALAEHSPSEFRAFGSGLVDSELEDIIGDSLTMVMPVVVVLMMFFLGVAYRDPFDLLLGLIAILMTMVWTFGFLGHAGIPFGQQMIVVPVLLLAVGVDFGIHIINRYREEKVKGHDETSAMRTTTSQLTIAFFMVTATAVFGFGANLFAELEPMREMGLAAGVGIVFAFFIFGGFLPAIKLRADRYRNRYDVPEFDSTPIATEESSLGRLLSLSATLGRRAPVLLIVAILLFGVAMGVYGAGVETSFEQEDFLPPEQEAWYVEYFPEVLAPGDYTATETLNLLEDRFEVDQDQSVVVYVEGPFEQNDALESLVRPDDDPPSTLVVGPENGVRSRSIVTVIQSHAKQDPEFARLVGHTDTDGDGIPDTELDRVYDELFSSPAGPQAERYLTDDYRAAQIEYVIEADATMEEVATDAADHADSFRYDATATGTPVVFNAVADLLFVSAVQGMVLALFLSSVFLVAVYGILEGRPGLGLVNVFPISIAIVCLLGTMRLLDMPLNAITALILSFAIGLGVDYTVHFMHRFVDEYGEGADVESALTTTLSSTGGALTGSMLTTSIGTGSLLLAVTPVLGDFGFLIALSVVYSFVVSVVALPPALFLWDRFVNAEATGVSRFKAVFA